jgi:uncharacterized RDD family membrane protein YckC
VPRIILNPTSANRREIPLSRTVLSIGRDPSNDVVLPDAMVSRRHAVIEYRNSQYLIRDCNSSNGSVVNGDRVAERTLHDGDLVAIGTARLLFRDEVVDAGAKVVPHPSAPRIECPSCRTEARRSDHFCRECGGALAPVGPPKVVCPACGTNVALPARFCTACGGKLSADGHRIEAPPPPAPADTPIAAATPEADEPATAPRSPVPGMLPTEPPPSGSGSASGSGSGSASGDFPSGSRRRRPNGSAAPAVADAPPAAPVPALRLARPPQAETAPGTEARPALHPARPLLGRRLAAALVDGLLVGVAAAVLLLPVARYWSLRDPADVSFAAILLSVTAAALVLIGALFYPVAAWGLRGATVGQWLLGLTVTGEDGRAPIGLGRAVLRLVGVGLSVASFGIGFAMAAFVGETLHDRLARTRVTGRG